MKSFIFGKTDDSPFESLKELKTEYVEKRKQSLNYIFLTRPQIKEISNTKVHLQSTREPDTNILKLFALVSISTPIYQFLQDLLND